MAYHDCWKKHRTTQYYRTPEAARRRRARNLHKKRVKEMQRRQARLQEWIAVVLGRAA